MTSRVGTVALALVLALVLAMASHQTAHAVSSRSGEHILIGPDETVDDDLFASGTTIEVQGHVRGDVVAVGTEVTIAGEVDGNVFAAATTVNVTGKVHGDVVTVAGTLTQKGSVDRSLVALTQETTMSADSSIGGNLVTGTGKLNAGGTVGRGIEATASSATLSGHVARNVDLSTGPLTVSPDARIGGILSYISDQQATIPTGVASGGVRRISVAQAQQGQQSAGSGAASTFAVFQILWMIGNIILGIVAVRLFPTLAAGARTALTTRPAASLGLGVSLCIAVPLGAFVAAVTVVGLPLSILAMALLVAAIELGWVFAAAGIASAVVGRVQQGPATAPQEVLVIAGLLVLYLLTRIPILGGAIWLVVLFLGTGALVQAVVGAARSKAKTPSVVRLQA